MRTLLSSSIDPAEAVIKLGTTAGSPSVAPNHPARRGAYEPAPGDFTTAPGLVG